MRVLVLQGLDLTSVPAEMSKLTSLRELELCYNQLTDLPDTFKELRNLKDLRIVGKANGWVSLRPTFSFEPVLET